MSYRLAFDPANPDEDPEDLRAVLRDLLADFEVGQRLRQRITSLLENPYDPKPTLHETDVGGGPFCCTIVRGRVETVLFIWTADDLDQVLTIRGIVRDVPPSLA